MKKQTNKTPVMPTTAGTLSGERWVVVCCGKDLGKPVLRVVSPVGNIHNIPITKDLLTQLIQEGLLAISRG